jgi:prolyl 4-hydroxylase|tara:strand:- start:4752 stop:5402 length:651 start_codon:yes stop_codon:yes gene_type:complete
MKWPKFTKEGFRKVKLPQDLYVEIFGHYSQGFNPNQVTEEYTFYDDQFDEFVADGSIAVRGSDKPISLLDGIPSELLIRWSERLRPMMERWSNTSLVYSNGYGIREYIPNSVLCCHRDRKDTHVISCIIFIDESPKGTNWPLEFVDHEKNIHKVVFERGDMLLYESLCPHSRITPFRGDYYRNMYFHWRPADWDDSPYNGKVKYSCLQEVLDEEVQ